MHVDHVKKFFAQKSGHVFQIHLTSSNLWYYGAWKLQLFHYGLYKLCSSESYMSYLSR